MLSPPTGNVTFLFTDIEGSTRLWERCPDAMRLALARHDLLLRNAIERHHGYVFKTVGDAFCAAFQTASEALAAALDIHLALLEEVWGESGSLRVRIGLHTGEAEERDNDYFGQTLNRVARLQGIGHGQQTLLSQATYQCVFDRLPESVALSDMGRHRLKDLAAPERVWQLLHPLLPSEFPGLKSLDYLPTNLPRQMTSFIGREREMEAVKQQLKSSALVTLIGTGGTGKTRLSLQVAADLLDDYKEGAWLVELASLADPSLVAQAIATAMELREEPGRPILKTLLDFLKDRELLLLLDNCEHLLEECATLAETLLEASPQLTILATSREPLGIPGEHPWRVPSLEQPDPHHLPVEKKEIVAALLDYDAIRLFVERAIVHRPGFHLSQQNASAVASVCHRLDGIPLAIELAAARIKALTVEQIAHRLDDMFRLLTGGSRTALPRQQTLKALIDWSYDLLNDQEKLLLQRLSLFSNGWTLEAAEQVCADIGEREEIEGKSEMNALPSIEVLDLLTSLVDKSLVVYEEHDGAGRYRLLETVRQYAADRLNESEQAEAYRFQHRDYYLQFVEEGARQIHGPDQARWLERFEDEHDNLRQTLTFCEKNRSDAGKGLRLVAMMATFWAVRGYLNEGSEWYATVLAWEENAAPTSDRALALLGAGNLAYCQGNYPVARERFEAALAIRQQHGHRSEMAGVLGSLGNIAHIQGDYGRARSLFEQTLEISREGGKSNWEASALTCLANLTMDQGDYSAARAYYEDALACNRKIGNRGMEALNLQGLGRIAMAQDDPEKAISFYEQALALSREIGHRSNMAGNLYNLANAYNVLGDGAASASFLHQALSLVQEGGDLRSLAGMLEGTVTILLKQGGTEAAARLLGAAKMLRETLGAPATPEQQMHQEQRKNEICARLGEQEFEAATAEGRHLDWEQAIKFALNHLEAIFD